MADLVTPDDVRNAIEIMDRSQEGLQKLNEKNQQRRTTKIIDRKTLIFKEIKRFVQRQGKGVPSIYLGELE